jgi:hypothetical protein
MDIEKVRTVDTRSASGCSGQITITLGTLFRRFRPHQPRRGDHQSLSYRLDSLLFHPIDPSQWQQRVRSLNILYATVLHYGYLLIPVPDHKRKASEEALSPDSQQQSKKARTDSPEKEPKVRLYVGGGCSKRRCADNMAVQTEDEPLGKPPLRIVPFPEKVISLPPCPLRTMLMKPPTIAGSTRRTSRRD